MNSMKTPLVSVIIPVFNRAGLIVRTIESVLAQSITDMEVIIVDDASTDNTGAVVENIGDPRVKYFRLETNGGPSIARNTGVERAEGEYVAFLDSDDEWDTKKLELQLAAIRQQTVPHNVVCYTKVNVIEDTSSYLLPGREKNDDEPVGDFILCGGHGLILTSSIMLPHELAATHPFPVDQTVCEDWDLFLRLEDKGVKWVYVDQPLTTWHNEGRKDRLTLSQYDGSIWLDEHKSYLSKKAQNAFSITGIVLPLIRSRQRKLYSLKLLVTAFPGGDLPLTEFLRLAIKILIPPAPLKRMKTCITFGLKR